MFWRIDVLDFDNEKRMAVKKLCQDKKISVGDFVKGLMEKALKDEEFKNRPSNEYGKNLR